MKITAMSTMCGDIFMHTGEIRPGGECLNFAAVACEYPGIDVHLLGAIGDDACGKTVLESIQNKRIGKDCIHVIPGGVTACNKTYLTEDGDRYYKPDSWNGGVYAIYQLTAQDVQQIVSSDAVFLNYGCANFDDVLALRKEHGFTLAVDFDVERDFAKLEALLPWIDYFFISGEESLLPVLKGWSERYDGVFNATLAEQGSVTYLRGQEHRVAAAPVKEIVDTTGCGDSYHAGFLCEYARSCDVIAAMNEGSRAASRTLSHLGGFLY